jgi:HK97 gp10 family phage protein
MRVDMSGLDEVLQNLTRLNIDETLENRALTKAGKVTQQAVQNEASFGIRSKGTIKKNIKFRRPRDGEVVIHTGRAFHAHIEEFGRSGGSIVSKSGRKVTWGATAPNPFFSRGFEQSKKESMGAMISELQKGLGL